MVLTWLKVILEESGREAKGMTTRVQFSPIVCPSAKSLSLPFPVCTPCFSPVRATLKSAPGALVLAEKTRYLSWERSRELQELLKASPLPAHLLPQNLSLAVVTQVNSKERHLPLLLSLSKTIWDSAAVLSLAASVRITNLWSFPTVTMLTPPLPLLPDASAQP